MSGRLCDHPCLFLASSHSESNSAYGMPGDCSRFPFFTPMNTFAFHRRIPVRGIEISLLSIAFVLFVAALLSHFLTGCSEKPIPANAYSAANPSKTKVPIVIWHQQASVIPSDKVASIAPPDQKYPLRGFVIAPMGGTLCAFASRDLIREAMPDIFEEKDVWRPLSADGTLMVRYLPDGLPGYESPVVKKLKGNCELVIKMPVIRQTGPSKWEVRIDEIALQPDEEGRGFQMKLEDGRQKYLQYQAKSAAAPPKFLPESQWAGNGVYRKDVEIDAKTDGDFITKVSVDVLVGIVWDCRISVIGTVPPETKAIVRVIAIPIMDSDAAETPGADTVSASAEIPASISNAVGTSKEVP